MLDALLDISAIPGETPLHRLWAGTKLIAVFALTVGLSFSRGLWGFVAVAGVLLAGIVAGRIAPALLWRSVRLLVIVFIITAVVLLITTSGTPIFRIGPAVATTNGAELALRAPVLLLLIVLLAQLVNRTTPPAESVAALGVLLQPLRRVRLPVDEFLTMLAISLRFLPILAEEITRLREAQAARGLSPGRGSLDARLLALESWMTTLITNTIRRAGELGEAMDARGYGAPDAGTFPVVATRLRALDWLVLAGSVGLAVAMLIVK